MLPPREPLSEPWNGVSLGGWLLLEPGPSYPLFDRHPDKDGEEARCEWDLLKILQQKHGKRRAAEIIKEHRDTHISMLDFERIRDCGLNAVRLPFGYWVVLGADKGEPYVGPALEYIDRALDWAEQVGLQVVLDLHGCPGGESGEAPCGRRQRPHGTWTWQRWQMKQTLAALKVVVTRYSSRQCVTGITVCNEPSNEVPSTQLCRYYSRAVDVVRRHGMPANRVTVVLPLFQRSEHDFILRWQEIAGSRQHESICFDVHCYHCFENEFNGKTLAQQFRAVEDNCRMLQRYPMVVGEWSLSLGCAAWSTCGQMQETQVYKLFACLQREAFKEASHGHFFWNWSERPDDMEWNFQKAYHSGLFTGPPLELPSWNGLGEDPLEEQMNPSPAEAEVRFGDPVYLRVFYGRYVDVQGGEVNATWPDKGTWQQFSFHHIAAASKVQDASQAGREVRHGDIVRLRSRSGRFLSVGEEGRLCAIRAGCKSSVEFTVHMEHGSTLRHRSYMYLHSNESELVVDADGEEDGLFTRYCDFGWWQQLAVEKHLEDDVPDTPARERDVASAVADLKAVAAAATPPRPRRRTLQVSPPLIAAGVKNGVQPCNTASPLRRRSYARLGSVRTPSKQPVGSPKRTKRTLSGQSDKAGGGSPAKAARTR